MKKFIIPANPSILVYTGLTEHVQFSVILGLNNNPDLAPFVGVMKHATFSILLN